VYKSLRIIHENAEDGNPKMNAPFCTFFGHEPNVLTHAEYDKGAWKK
jgi:hypothetical protein